MTTPVDIFDFIIAPIREADARDGHDFLCRFLRGCQEVWERTDQNLRSIPTLWSVDDCPDDFLWYLKNIVGWTREFDSLLGSLSAEELRRLISVSGQLWRERGSEDALLDVLYFAAGARCRYWNWFDFRWILDETELGEDHDGHDPWMVELPDPDVSGAEYESNLRIVDDGTLNRSLVARLIELERGTGERWETTFLGLLDMFRIDGDDSQWDRTYGDFIRVAEGKMTIGDPAGAAFTYCVIPSAVWPETMCAARIRADDDVTALLFFWHWTDMSNNYGFAIVPEGSISSPPILLVSKTELGSITYLATIDMSAEPIRRNVYYTYRVIITNEGAVGKRIRIYIDGNLYVDLLDDPSLLPEGTVGFGAFMGTVDVSEIETVLIPQDQPPVRAVPVPFITEWAVAGDAAARTIELPLVENRTEGALGYDFIVDWGDGTTPSHVTAWDDSNRIHTYDSNGTYQVSIRGQMEGWSFNGSSSAPKITRVLQWGQAPWFLGFAYLKNAFKGCVNLVSIQGDPIPAKYSPSYPGVLSEGFEGAFYGCGSLPEVYADLFDLHPEAANFRDTFRDCVGLTSLPAAMFSKALKLGDFAFSGTFRGCTGLLDLPRDLFDADGERNESSSYTWESCFRNCTGLTALSYKLFHNFPNADTHVFDSAFRGCTSLVSVMSGMFDMATIQANHYAWLDCFRDCTALTSAPGHLFSHGAEVTSGGVSLFEGTFRDCTALTSLGWGLFYYNKWAYNDGFKETFRGCTALASVPNSLFNEQIYCGGFVRTFYQCAKLQFNEWTFYNLASKFTRFALVGYQFCDFTECFYRSTFTGAAGKAPELWLGTYKERIELSPLPSVAWVANDHIVGQTSGDDCYIDAPTANPAYYDVKKRRGYFQLDEVIGVTGVPSKLADQNGTHPVWYRHIVSETCYSGAGNDGSSITNFTEIPSNWK